MMAPNMRNSHVLDPFEAPPSTFAAQLIDNPAPGKPSNNAEHTYIQGLLAEVALEEQNLESADAEKLAEHKHKLIYVCYRSILEKLAQDDIVKSLETMLEQALDTLDVFMTAIRVAPAVLDYVLKPGYSIRTRGQEPLWVWLFPRIQTLLGRRQYSALDEKIKQFFRISFQVVAKSPKIWNLSSSFFCYFKDCTSGKDGSFVFLYDRILLI